MVLGEQCARKRASTVRGGGVGALRQRRPGSLPYILYYFIQECKFSFFPSFVRKRWWSRNVLSIMILRFPLKEPGEKDKNAPCGSSDPMEPHPQARMLIARSSDLSGGQSHLISQSFKLPGRPSLSMLAISFRKVVCSSLLIGLTSCEHMIVDHQNAVCHCHDSTFVAAASSNLMIRC